MLIVLNCIIYGLFPRCKCANRILFHALCSANSTLDFPEKHLGNITGCVPENSCGIGGVEIYDPREIFGCEIVHGVYSAAREYHECDTVLCKKSQPVVQIVVIQIFQQAVSLSIAEHSSIVRNIIFREHSGQLHDLLRETGNVRCFTVSIDKRFRYCRNHRRPQLPEANFTIVIAVGVADVKDIAQLIRQSAFRQQRNAARAAIDPSAKPVPSCHICAGSCLWLLRVDQNLFVIGVLVVSCGGAEKVQIPSRVRSGSNRGLRCQI